MLTIFTLIIVALIGGALSKAGVVPTTVKDLLQKYVYYFAAPVAVIYAIGTNDFSSSSRYIKFLAVNVLTYLVFFLVTYLALKKKKVQRKIAGVIAFSSNAPNTVFLGFPLVLAVFGQEAFVYVVLLGSLSDALLNAVRLFMLHKYKTSSLRRSKHTRPQLFGVVKGVVVNSFFIALIVGCVLNYFKVLIPQSLYYVGLSASYAALLALGLSVGHLKINKADYGEIILTSGLKLAALPLFVLVPAQFLLDTTARNVSVFVAALPTAVLSLIVAQNLKFDEKLAPSIILATTALSVVSLSGWYVVLKLILV